MAVYTAEQLRIKPPPGGFTENGWFQGRNYIGGTFSEPGQLHPSGGQPGAGQMVSPQVNAASAGLQGVTPAQLETFLQTQRSAGGTTPTTPGFAGGGGGGAGTGVSMPVAPSINLPDLYKSLTKDSGIEAIQADLSAKEKAYNEAVSKINDNPFLSEASRVGRQQKLTIDYQNSIKSLQNDVATKKADIETQLNLKSKQFDIESDQAKQALSQFNTLLEMGSLNNASGDEIAAITRTTGISSGMIQSAINAQKAKNVKTTLIEYDDGTHQGVAVIDSKRNIINKQVIAPSKPLKPTEPTAQSIVNDINDDLKKYTKNQKVTINGKTGKAQSLISPEDFVKLMLQTYPSNVADIPKSGELRKITGQVWKK